MYYYWATPVAKMNLIKNLLTVYLCKIVAITDSLF